ncbi:MAG: hypothetical protein ACTS46_00940 [Candidatus Hodgkinia cicadicola]
MYISVFISWGGCFVWGTLVLTKQVCFPEVEVFVSSLRSGERHVVARSFGGKSIFCRSRFDERAGICVHKIVRSEGIEAGKPEVER